MCRWYPFTSYPQTFNDVFVLLGSSEMLGIHHTLCACYPESVSDTSGIDTDSYLEKWRGLLWHFKQVISALTKFGRRGPSSIASHVHATFLCKRLLQLLVSALTILAMGTESLGAIAEELPR